MTLWTPESLQIRKIKHLAAANNAHKDLELSQRDETQSTQITMLKYWSGTIKIIHKIKIIDLW